MTKIIAGEHAHKIVLMSKEDIKSDQDGIRKDVLSLDQRVHANAVQCLLHAETHGDTSLMRRLLVEVLGRNTTATGYRTAGLINWVRKFSPIELKGDTLNLSGVIDQSGINGMVKQFPEMDTSVFTVGAKRPFLVALAAATPFWSDADNAERVAKPVYRETVLSPIDRMIKDVLAAAENTVNGKPVDPSKAYYDGLNMDKTVDFVKKVRDMKAELPADETLAVRKAQAEQRRLGEFVEANKAHANAA